MHHIATIASGSGASGACFGKKGKRGGGERMRKGMGEKSAKWKSAEWEKNKLAV